MDRKKHIGIIDSILLCTLVIGLFFIISKMCVENNNDYDNTEDIEQTDTIFCYDDIRLITVNYDTPLRKKLNDYLWNLVSLML